MTLPKARDYTAGNRISRLDSLPAIRAEQSRLYRAVWAKKIDVNDAQRLTWMLGEQRRTLVAIAEREERAREIAAREAMAKHLMELARDPNRHLRSPMSVKIEVVDGTTPTRVQVIDGEANEVVELPAPANKDTLQ
jgi:hypothetical protein